MPLKFRIAAITDEYSSELAKALASMAASGMTGAELRMLGGRNIVDLSDVELDDTRRLLDAHGMEVMSIASPLLKCVLPDAPAVDARFQQDVFAARFSFDDQARLAERTFAIAQRMGARIVRVFSYWRVVRPEETFDRVAEVLRRLADQAASQGLIVGLENEAACNVATGAEAGLLLQKVDHPNLKIVWDPANALVAGENPFPDGYRAISPSRIAHVHAKDCTVTGHTPVFGPLGACAVDWKGQIAALCSDGYMGWISLETHWPGPGGDKHRASLICGENLRTLVSA